MLNNSRTRGRYKPYGIISIHWRLGIVVTKSVIVTDVGAHKSMLQNPRTTASIIRDCLALLIRTSTVLLVSCKPLWIMVPNQLMVGEGEQRITLNRLSL